MADQGPGPSLTDIAAARRHLHERQADMLAKMIPGAGGHTSQPDVGTTGDTPVGQGLKEAEDVASGIKTKMAHESGVHVPPQRPLPEGTNVNSNQGAGAGSTAATDPLSNVRAHSPVELPSTPAELPASPARDAADAAPPSSLQYPQAMSPPRVPSGVLLCNRGPAGRPAEPHAGSAAPLVATTSVPGSPPCVPATSAGMVDNALQMALAGSAGMEGPMEHGSPASASLRDHHHAFERGAGPAAQHAPTTITPSSHSHSGGAAGGGLLSRVMAPFVAHAEVGEGVSEEASEPQYADRQQPNPYDSNQAMNMGPEGDSRADNRAYVGGVPMALGSLADRVTNTLHDMVEAGARALGDNSGGPPPAVQPEDLPGMPGSMEIDEEIRAMRAEQAAQQAAARSAAREEAEAAEPAAGEGREGEGAAALHEAAEVHHAEDARTAEPTVGGGSGGGGVLGKLVGKVANVLHLHAPDSPEQQHADTSSSEGAPQQPQEFGERVGQQSAEERRADAPVPLKAPGDDVAAAAGRVPAHPGTSEVEQGPSGSPEEVAQARRELGIPAGAQHAAEARDDLNTKEGGQPGPAGALGQPRPNPDAHVQAYAPDAAQPNFFSEVERRGLGDVLKHGAANVKDRVQEMSDRSGGEPAAWAVTSGAVSDTRDITRNVERVDHMDDPTQRKIYDGETYKVGAQHPKVMADKRSEAEAAKEDTSAMVLGQNKPISGAVPHEKPDLPIGASGTGTGEGPKTAAAKGPFDGIGTAKGCAPDERDASVREATAPFLAYSEPSQGPAHGGSSVWSLAASAASAVASRIFPVAKAVGAGSAGTPTGTDRTQRPPTTDFGDNTAGRPDAAYGPPPGRSQDMPTPGGITNAPKAHVHRAHNKNEPPEGRDLVPEHTLMENIQSKLAGSPEAAGVPRRGVDEPGQRSDLLIPPLEEKAHRIHDGLPDKMARIGESVGGALQHVLDATSEAVKAVPNSMAGNVHPRESEQKRMAKEAPGGEEAGAVDPYTHPGGVVPAGLGEHGAGTARQMDLRSGGIMSAHHAARIEGALQDPEPARKRDTFMDKVLYPFSKDAGKPDAAIAQARSYYEYVEEKQKKQEVADKAAAEEEANRPLSDKAKDVASTAIEKAEEKMEKLHLGRLLPPGERARLEGHSSEGGSFGHKESPAPAKPPALGPEGKDGRLHLEQSDKPFSERDFNLDAPGARGPRVNEEGKAWTQSGSGTRHVTGDVVTEVPAALGQAVMDTGRSLMHKLGAGEQRAEDRASEAAQDVRGRSERAAEDVRASAERTAADVRDSAHRTAEDVRGAAERGGYEAKQAAHEAKAGGINLLDRAALAVGNVIETLVGGGSHTVPVPPAVAPASTSPTTASDLPRGVKEADVTYDTRPPHTERADDSGTYVHAPGTGTTGSADGGASLGVGGVKEEPQAGAGGEEGGLASRVLGKLGSMLGGGGEHGHGAKEQQGAAQEARDRLASAMAPAGEHDLAGYGRGASEHGLHIKEGEDRHVIPVMPYISTEELMKQRATQQQE